jgi:hypothetical protein
MAACYNFPLHTDLHVTVLLSCEVRWKWSWCYIIKHYHTLSNSICFTATEHGGTFWKVWLSCVFHCSVNLLKQCTTKGCWLGEDGLVVMTGAESVERYQIHQHMVSMVSRCLMPFHLLRSGHYYEPSSPQQHPYYTIPVTFYTKTFYIDSNMGLNPRAAGVTYWVWTQVICLQQVCFHPQS